MVLSPTALDIWLAKELAGLLRFSIPFNNGVAAAIHFGFLGGFWFGAALFINWVQSARKGQAEIQLRILTILVATAIAILLTFLAGAIISWPPPANYPALQKTYTYYFDANKNTNSFPSQSTALYATVAAGVYSIHKISGWVLWVMVPLLVALPRMYVGGHYFSDIFAGLLLAITGYAVARYLLEARLISKIQSYFEKTAALQYFREFLIFIWIFQVAVEFRETAWIKAVLESIL
jgi:membrane-associated phospholipid phosphatase